MTSLADRLADRALELVDVPSPSREEGPLAGHVLRVLREGGVPVRDAGDTCVVAGAGGRGERPLVLLAGHLDTVPSQGNVPGRRDGGAVHGLGASDMKGALAVMIELALDAPDDSAFDLGFVFFGREELPVQEGALTPLLEREPRLRTADLAIAMEPTDNELHAGCLGNVNATWTFRGVSGHSARPWLADNAVHRAAAGIHALAGVPAERHVFDGLEFAEVVSATRVEGGIAQNVIPDLARAHVNYRYPPGRAPEEAEARLRAWCEPHGELEITGHAPSGAVVLDHPLVDALRRAAGGLPIAPKQAWTPVAEFTGAGVPAVNFGPGAPAQAHRREEHVAIDALVRSFEVLDAFRRGA